MKKQSVSTIILTVLIIGIVITSHTCAKNRTGSSFIHPSDVFVDIKITNGKGDYLEYKDENESYDYDGPTYGGTMKIYEDDLFPDRYDSEWWILRVPDSEKFVIEDKHKKVKEWLEFELENKYNKYIGIDVESIKSVIVEKRKVVVLGEKNTSIDYDIGSLLTGENAYFNIKGVCNKGELVYEYTNNAVEVIGAHGKTNIESHDRKTEKIYVEGDYYIFSNIISFEKKGKRTILKAGIRIPDKTTKSVTSLYLRSANKGKNMFLTWNKVKGAKSYIVYKYSPVKNEFVKVAIRDSHNANYYNIPKTKNDIGYKYKIVAKSKSEGKGKKVCKTSYPVWAVAAGNAKGNVTSVTTNKKKIIGKVGKSIKLTAKVATGSKTTAGTTKKVLSKTIRWYSSNKIVASVNKKTGKVKFKKKGKCYIWAKAHNGKNSKKVKVLVK